MRPSSRRRLYIQFAGMCVWIGDVVTISAICLVVVSGIFPIETPVNAKDDAINSDGRRTCASHVVAPD